MPSNFQYQTGTTGFLVTPFNLMSTELNALAIAAGVISSVGGTSGVFSQTNTSSAVWGNISFNPGAAMSPTVAASLQGWFLRYDGSVYERTITGQPLPRSPDFIIPLYTSETTSPVHAQGPVLIPAIQFKIWIYNNTGVALPATGNLIKLGVFGIQGT